MLQYSAFRHPIGWISALKSDRGIAYIGLHAATPRDFPELQNRFPEEKIIPTSKGEVQDIIERWFETGSSDAPLDVMGTPFQVAVWRALKRIPRGKTLSYAELAKAAGNASAIRAVGSACGSNPVPLLIPCHRVLRADGNLGGYSCGPEFKKALLAWENKPVSRKKPRALVA